MTRARLFSAAAVLLTCLAGSTAAQAELVFFQSGRALSVKKYRFEGENLVLTLRSGGEISCSGELIARINRLLKKALEPLYSRSARRAEAVATSRRSDT